MERQTDDQGGKWRGEDNKRWDHGGSRIWNEPKGKKGSDMHLKTQQPQGNSSTKPQMSEEMWRSVRRRHCDARRHLRSLLGQHLKPHPVR